MPETIWQTIGPDMSCSASKCHNNNSKNKIKQMCKKRCCLSSEFLGLDNWNEIFETALTVVHVIYYLNYLVEL